MKKVLQIKIQYSTYEEYLKDKDNQYRELLGEYSIAVKANGNVVVVYKHV